MSEYVSRISLEFDGQVIEDFDSVEEKEREIRKPVHLMNKTGTAKITPRYGVTVDYVIPADGPVFDFESKKDGTLTIDRQNGIRVSFGGVACIKVGQVKYDGDNVAKQTIELIANRRTE